MEHFNYVALDQQGQRHAGSVLAANRTEAERQLGDQQLLIVALEAARARVRKSGGPVNVVALIDELSTLLEASVPLAEAVDTLALGLPADHPLHGILSDIRGGKGFSAALRESALALPDYVLQLVRSGETTGKLAAAMRAAAQHLESDAKIRQEARNAMIYPMVLVFSGIVATLVMFVFVVPRFASVLSNPKAELPWISQLILTAGLWLAQHQVGVGLVISVLLMLGFAAWQRKEVKDAAWELAARLPVLGPWTLHAELSRWSSLFAVLLQSKVPLLQALQQANETLRRRSLRTQAALVLTDVRGGRSLSESLGKHTILDAAGLNLIRVGERSGALAQTVASLARVHSNQAQVRLKRFLVLLEPITILGISVVLGGIMVSVMLAITSLTNVL